MKVLLLILAAALPVSFASARSVTIEVSDPLSFEKFEAWSDGTRAVTRPQVYGYFLGASSIGETGDNANAVCLMIGSSEAIHHSVMLTGRTPTTINFEIENGKVSEPRFGSGGELETMVLSKVICR